MSDPTLIAQLATLITVVGGVLLQFYNSYKSNQRKDRMDEKMEAGRVVSEEQNKKLEALHVATNGLTEKLAGAKLAQGDAEGHARGLEDGRQEKIKATKPTGDKPC